MSEELKRYKEALEVAVQGLRDMGLDFAWHYEAVEAKINAILHPEPEYVEIETAAYRCPSCMRLHENDKSDCVCGKYCFQFIKLTGTLRRPKPAKVERSVTVEEVRIAEGGGILDWPSATTRSLLQGTPACGKTVTLTATWTE